MEMAIKIKQLYKKLKKRLKSTLQTETKEAQVFGGDGTLRRKPAEYLVKYGEWLKESISSEGDYVRLEGAGIEETIIPCDISLVAQTRARDAAIERCLHSGKYTEEKFLIIKNPYQLSPLTALILFQSEKEYRIRIEVEGKHKEMEQEEAEEREYYGSTEVSGITELTKEHRVPIIGLYPGSTNTVSMQFFDKENVFCKTIVFKLKMKPLPDTLKNMVIVKKNLQPSAFGLTFVYGGDSRYPYAFDRKGDVRLYIARQPKPYGLHFLSNGHFLFAEKNVLMPSFSNPHSSQVLEMDILGRVHRIYNVKNGLHHDAGEMVPGGNLIAAGSSLENSNEDMIMELDRKTGKIVKEIKLGNIFDKTYQDGIDWVHLNTVSYDEKTNSVLICCRNLHTVAKINWETGKLQWMLCNPRFWRKTSMEEKLLKPVGKNLKKEGWFYQAHAAYFLDENFDKNPDMRYMIIYDNHWHKRRSVSFFDGDPNSFVRIYAINEKENTVSLWKSFPCEKSKIRSNGILCLEQNRLFAMSGFLEPPVDSCGGMINEYNFETGELINQYLTKMSYYRAYELPLNYIDLGKAVEQNSAYMLGTIREPRMIERPEISRCIPLPARAVLASADNTYYKGTKAERKKKYEEALENGDAPFDIEQDIANTELELCENILYIKAVDHLVRNVYFVGEKYCYIQEYGDTKQTNPGLFARLYYAVMVPLGKMESDQYRVYLECEGKLYDTGETFKIGFARRIE